MKSKTYKQYSRAFKLKAIRLAGAGDKPAAQVARELGIRVNQLRKWKLQFEAEKANGGPAKRGRPADGELEHLRHENERLKEENSILRKAASFYFAQESK